MYMHCTPLRLGELLKEGSKGSYFLTHSRRGGRAHHLPKGAHNVVMKYVAAFLRGSLNTRKSQAQENDKGASLT